MNFRAENGRLHFENEHVHKWRCPGCKCWRPAEEARCPIDGSARDLITDPVPEMLHEPAD